MKNYCPHVPRLIVWAGIAASWVLLAVLLYLSAIYFWLPLFWLLHERPL